MARQHSRNVLQAISIENVARGVYLDDGAEFRKFPSDPRPGTFPTRDVIPDNMVGRGQAYAQQSSVGRVQPVNLPYAGALNSTIAVRLFRMFLGGTITETARTTPGTIDSAIAMKAAGAEPMFANVIEKNGGREFLWGDVFVQTFNISQSGDGEPRVDATLQNSGYHKKLSDTSIDTADVEDLADYLKARGFKTRLTFSDGTTTFNPANTSDLIDVSFAGSQNVVVDGLPGDLPINASNECLGSYSKNVAIDVQSAVITYKAYQDATFAIYDSWAVNKKLTNVTLIFYSCQTIGLTTDVFEWEIKLPVAEFNLTPDSQGNFDAYSATITAIEGDSVTGSLVLGRIRQVDSIDETLP